MMAAVEDGGANEPNDVQNNVQADRDADATPGDVENDAEADRDANTAPVDAESYAEADRDANATPVNVENNAEVIRVPNTTQVNGESNAEADKDRDATPCDGETTAEADRGADATLGDVENNAEADRDENIAPVDAESYAEADRDANATPVNVENYAEAIRVPNTTPVDGENNAEADRDRDATPGDVESNAEADKDRDATPCDGETTAEADRGADATLGDVENNAEADRGRNATPVDVENNAEADRDANTAPVDVESNAEADRNADTTPGDVGNNVEADRDGSTAPGNSRQNLTAERGRIFRGVEARRSSIKNMASKAIRAYTSALGEVRDARRLSFASWTTEQIQDFLVLNGVEVRGATMLSHSQFGAIIERMYSGCTDPPLPPEPRSDDEKAQREQAVQLLQAAWFNKKRAQWAKNEVEQQKPDGHLRDNPLMSPRGVMAAANRGRISEDTPWAPPSVEEARIFQDKMHPRQPDGGKYDLWRTSTGRYALLGGFGKQLDLWDEGEISEFAPYGASVTSYFKFIKFCAWSFAFATGLVMPHLFVNFEGDYIKPTAYTDKMSWTTMGNLGTSTNVTEVALPFCDATQYAACVVEKDRLGLYYGVIDTFLVMLFLASYYRFSSLIVAEFEVIKRNTLTAGDYTVMVQHLPEHVTEEELATHFSTVLPWTVVEVALARDTRKCIQLYAQSGALYHQRAETRDLIRYMKTKAREEKARLERLMDDGGWWEEMTRSVRDWRRELKIKRLRRERDRACRQILNLAAEAKMEARITSKRVAAAFVTFEQEMGAVSARTKYSDSWLGWLFMRRQLKMRGRRLAVTEAPEPSTILWENYGFGKCELATRRVLTLVAAASFIGLSTTMSVLALYQNQEAKSEGGTADCPDNWDSWTAGQQEDAGGEDSDILHCLCSEIGIASLRPDDVCFDYVKARAKAFWLVLGTSFVVAFTNAGINRVVKMMGSFEKHKCMDDQEVSIFRRLLLLKFVNVGLTIMITNNRAIIDIVGLTIDYEENFTPEWYRTLGSSLVLTVVMNAVTPHLYWLFVWASKEWIWKRTEGQAISQEALNNLAKGVRWEVSVRYAEIAVIFAVCVAYSAGIPILLPVGAASFLVFYWVEKALFVHFYLTPPTYSIRLSNEVISFIPYCLWIHTVISIYMYGNGSIFPVDTSSDESAEEAAENASEAFNFESKLKVKAVLPLLFPFFTLTALILNRWIGRTVVSAVAWMLVALTCERKLKSKELKSMRNAVPVDYSRAVVRGILRSLPSYNILLNPKYKESFGLSDAFACRHKRVGSIFMLLEEHPSIVLMRKTLYHEREARKSHRQGEKRGTKVIKDVLSLETLSGRSRTEVDVASEHPRSELSTPLTPSDTWWRTHPRHPPSVMAKAVDATEGLG